MSAPVTLAKALNEGLRKTLEDDPKVLIMGEDVGKFGGVFRITDGLQKDFGDQKVDHDDLALGFQFACEHPRTHAAQPQLTDHSEQNQSPPAGVEGDRNPNPETEGSPKMLYPTDYNVQFA